LGHQAAQDWALSADPESAAWKGIQGVETSHDRYNRMVAGARTEIRSRWTKSNAYFLFISNYQTQYLKANPTREETWGLWEYDVVEIFIGWELDKINRYKEFEFSPQDEFVDLDVDRDKPGSTIDWKWNGGVEFKNRIDRERKIWYCEVRIPWKSIDTREPKIDNELRLNLYRIEGGPNDRKYLAWQPVYNPSFHTPQGFGRLRLAGAPGTPRKDYDILLRGGHVIDGKHQISARMDVAVFGGAIAALGPSIDPGRARRTVDVTGLYVAPGLVDLHTHVANGSGLLGSLPTDQNVFADSHTLRHGVTTVVDAGTSGWRSFAEFKKRNIDTAVTRILASINIVGAGQAGPAPEQNTADMDAEATAKVAIEHRGTIVGVKTAHYRGPEWVAVERAVEAGRKANIPVMVDFGYFHPARPFQELVLDKLRPGDMYTHTYLAAVPMLDAGGKVQPYLFAARKRGVKFDVGHGGGSFAFRQAVPAVAQGFLPDSISTDLHTGSMNGPMNNMLNVMSKFLNMGMTLEDVITRSTWNPAQQIQRPDLGNFSIGAPADIAVLRVETGSFGFVDVLRTRMEGTRRLSNELTIRDGKVVYDLNGRTRQDWRNLGQYGSQADPIVDGVR
jgi:dihydroorotase